jgi:translation initiation factor 2 alpha subunit (eIF-2alpha)
MGCTAALASFPGTLGLVIGSEIAGAVMEIRKATIKGFNKFCKFIN